MTPTEGSIWLTPDNRRVRFNQVRHMQDHGFVYEYVGEGGGFVCYALIAEWERAFKPAPDADTIAWRPARVSCGDNPDYTADGIPCYLRDELRWNGWQMPVFEREHLERTLGDGGYYVGSWDGDTFVVTHPDQDDGPERYEATTILVDGRLIPVWGVGAGSWTWSLVPCPPIVLAREFCKQLKETLTPTEFSESQQRNLADPDPRICHSHDFCDANQIMLNAMDELGIDDDVVWNEDNDGTELVNAAWDIAKAANYVAEDCCQLPQVVGYSREPVLSHGDSDDPLEQKLRIMWHALEIIAVGDSKDPATDAATALRECGLWRPLGGDTTPENTHQDRDSEYAYQQHIAKEGTGQSNDHPDGCWYCGSPNHHSIECEDR